MRVESVKPFFLCNFLPGYSLWHFLYLFEVGEIISVMEQAKLRKEDTFAMRKKLIGYVK